MRLTRTILLASTLLAATPANADTLRDALNKAYRSNPTLTGARAALRAQDEAVPLARARGLPNIGVTGGFTENALQTSNSFQPDRTASAGVDLSIPIYSGGSVRNGIRAADARVESGRASLRDTEASLFTNVVAAYMDVIRDQALVSLNQANVRVLDVNLQATRDRFEVGDLTRTDVAQSEARLSLARGDLQTAESNLIGSREQYLRLVGDPPVDLQPPPPLPGVPVTPNAAVTIALDNNPALLAARREEEASRFDVSVARASRLPRLSAVTGARYSNALGSQQGRFVSQDPTQISSIANSSTTGTAGLQGSIPLFQGGGPSAQIRQAQARQSQSIERITETERGIVAQTRAAYASQQAAAGVIVSSERAVQANELSLEGVQAENSVGTRTILDILDAQQELLNTQTRLVSARRNAYVAGFSLLAAMGRAEARDLGLEGGVLYDPTENYRRVRNRISDFDSDPTPTPVGTRTVDSPAQTPAVTGPPR